ncbi:hypothetical protein MVEN_00079800 [Mycena venus]|uniref:Uncharacterized protein n=1 Tax=Mycena venus TaxID=2733690 RepID=A0A8H7DF91_9AGAR|nr:hypothetical protein MVEN_00079800 [Mycena venus]
MQCLDAGTNNLAQLITHLDSEATPGTLSRPRSYCPKGRMARESTGQVKDFVHRARTYTVRKGSAVLQTMAWRVDCIVAQRLPLRIPILHQSSTCCVFARDASLTLTHDVLFVDIAPAVIWTYKRSKDSVGHFKG